MKELRDTHSRPKRKAIAKDRQRNENLNRPPSDLGFVCYGCGKIYRSQLGLLRQTKYCVLLYNL